MTRTPLKSLATHAQGVLLERLLAIADDAVVVADAQMRVVVFNEGAERAFGYRAAQVLGQPLSMLLPESVRAAHDAHVRRFAGSGRPSRRMGERSDIHGQRSDGSLFNAEASITYLEQDGAAYFTAILRDVSESRRAAAALARSEARFRQLAEVAPVGIFQADGEGRLVYVNDRWCSIAGLAVDQAQGWLLAVHAEDRQRVRLAWQEALARQRPFVQRFRFVRADNA